MDIFPSKNGSRFLLVKSGSVPFRTLACIPKFIPIDGEKEPEMKAKILGVSASPQRAGKVETLMREVLSSSRLPFELVRLHELRIKPCKACNRCRRDDSCVIPADRRFSIDNFRLLFRLMPRWPRLPHSTCLGENAGKNPFFP
jgi:hypothetical protein